MKTDELDIMLMTDQPEECHECGVRTEFMQLTEMRQIHVCPNCNEVFLLDDDED